MRRAAVVLVSLLVSGLPAMAQNEVFEIPPGDGLDFFQMNWFYPGGPPIQNSDWGRAVADPRRIAEITGIPSGYLNVVTEDGWVIQNWFLDSSEALTLDGGLPAEKGAPQRRVSTTLRHSWMEFSEYRRLAFSVY